MGPCTTAWFHSDWSSKVGPTLLTNLPSLVTAPQATLSQPVQHSLDKLCSWPSLGTQRSVEKKKIYIHTRYFSTWEAGPAWAT